MVYSMTGFGKGEAKEKDYHVITEIKTVNHRFLDFRIHSSYSLQEIEEEIQKRLKKHFYRGRINVTIHIEDLSSSTYDVKVDWNLLDQYMEVMNKVKERYSLKSGIPLEIIHSIPELFSIDVREQFMNDLKDPLLMSLDEAILDTKRSRKREGKFLKKDLIERFNRIIKNVLFLKEKQPIFQEEYSQRVQERITLYTKDLSEIDHNRLHQEIAFLIERGDITEEIVRLKSHLKHSLHLLKSVKDSKPIGRKLDFIVQEIHRELNTIGSKATNEKIGQITVNSKSELEKIREQIQNIE